MSQFELSLGQGAVSAAPNVISARGLGSCVALALYDGRTRVGGMAHVMLPHGGDARPSSTSAYGYADTAVGALLADLRGLGADFLAIKAKMAGGARMFDYAIAHYGSMGDQNVAQLVAQLSENGIAIAGMDVGGNKGRNVMFDLSTGTLTVKAFGQVDRVL